MISASSAPSRMRPLHIGRYDARRLKFGRTAAAIDDARPAIADDMGGMMHLAHIVMKALLI